jgi:hypothetical protein
MTIKTMTQDTKNQIANLERQKIALEDRLDNLSYFKGFETKSDKTMQEVTDELFEVKDTIKKLIG